MGEEVKYFPFCNFLKYFFSYTIFKQFYNIYLLKTKIRIRIGHFWQKLWIILVFTLWPFQAKILAGGIFYNFFVLPVPARWNCHICYFWDAHAPHNYRFETPASE